MIYLDVLSVADDVAGHIKRLQELFPGGAALHERQKGVVQHSRKETRLPLPGTVPSDGPLRGVAHLTSMVWSTSTEWFVGHLALPGRLSSSERSFRDDLSST
jgi:hypothetical protein